MEGQKFAQLINNDYLYIFKEQKSNQPKTYVIMKTSVNTTSTSKSNFRARIMKYAWQIWKATQTDWRGCMLKAWQLYYLAKGMRKGPQRFTYIKADGSVRDAVGTLVNLPAGVTVNGKKVTKPSYKTFAYFDVDKQSFRCFKVENLLTVAS